MFKKLTLITVSMIMVSLLATSAVFAAKTKYEFSDVEINGQIVEIEASVKQNKKNEFSTCSYYSDNYEEFLGQYQEAIVAGETSPEIKDFCLENFDNRSQ